MRILFALFVVIPIVEMVILIKVGSAIGALPTVALVFATAAVGAALIRKQGIAAMQRVRLKLHSGELPAQELIDGFCLAVGGALLLTPGFVTDAVGFVLLLPAWRQWLMRAMFSRMIVRSSLNTGRTEPGSSHPRSRVLDGEYHRED